MAIQRIPQTFRTAIVIFLGEPGKEVYQRLASLCAGLPRGLPNEEQFRCIEFIDVSLDTGALMAERLPMLTHLASMPTNANPDAIPDATVSPGGLGARAPFGETLRVALRSVQDDRTLNTLARVGYQKPISRAQILIVGDHTETALLNDVRAELQIVLPAFAREVGIRGDGQTLITYLLDHPPAPGVLPPLANGNRPGATSGAALSTFSVEELLPAFSDDAIFQQMIIAGSGANAPRVSLRLLYPESTQSGRIYPLGRIRYLMAEAAFTLIATGLTITESFSQAIDATQSSGANAPAGSLGVSMLRFPRADAEVYCQARLGAELLEQWANAAPDIPYQEMTRRRQAQRRYAGDFADALQAWLRNLLQRPSKRVRPMPTMDLWPTEKTVLPQTTRALDELRRVTQRIEDHLDYEALLERTQDRERDQRGAARKDLWQSVTTTAYADAQSDYGLWEGAARNAWDGMERELIHVVNGMVDGLWMADQPAWADAAAYFVALDDEIGQIRDQLADWRQQDDADFRDELVKYERRAYGPWAQTGGQLRGPDGAIDIVIPRGGQSTPVGAAMPTGPSMPAAAPGPAPAAASPAPSSGYAVGVGAGATGAGATGAQAAATGGATPGATPGAGTGAQGATAPPASPIETPQQRAERVRELLGQRAAYMKSLRPSATTLIGASLALAPGLVALARDALTLTLTNQPLELGVAGGSVAALLTAGSVLYSRIAENRVDRARRDHVEFMRILSQNQRDVRESQFMAARLIRVHNYIRKLRQQLENWREQLLTASRRLAELASETSRDLFDPSNPIGSHDVFIANGVRLSRDLTAEQTGRELEPIYSAVNAKRRSAPREIWQATQEGINDEMRRRFREQNVQLLGLEPEQLANALRSFLRWLTDYITDDVSGIRPALVNNPSAMALWMEVVSHAEPLYDVAGADLPYVAADIDNLNAITQMGAARGADQLTTVSDEWALMAQFRRSTDGD